MHVEIHPKLISLWELCSFIFNSKKSAEFKHGHTSLDDDPHYGHPKSVTSGEIVQCVHDMVLDDHKRAWNSGGHRHLKRASTLHINWNFKKSVLKMGAAFINMWSKTRVNENALFGLF